MNQIQKRFLLFIFGCITTRILITILEVKQPKMNNKNRF